MCTLTHLSPSNEIVNSEQEITVFAEGNDERVQNERGE
jgi:hypothetical protein